MVDDDGEREKNVVVVLVVLYILCMYVCMRVLSFVLSFFCVRSPFHILHIVYVEWNRVSFSFSYLFFSLFLFG